MTFGGVTHDFRSTLSALRSYGVRLMWLGAFMGLYKRTKHCIEHGRYTKIHGRYTEGTLLAILRVRLAAHAYAVPFHYDVTLRSSHPN